MDMVNWTISSTYIAMELLGPSVGHKVKDHGGLMVNTVIRIQDQVVRTHT